MLPSMELYEVGLLLSSSQLHWYLADIDDVKKVSSHTCKCVSPCAWLLAGTYFLPLVALVKAIVGPLWRGWEENGTKCPPTLLWTWHTFLCGLFSFSHFLTSTTTSSNYQVLVYLVSYSISYYACWWQFFLLKVTLCKPYILRIRFVKRKEN